MKPQENILAQIALMRAKGLTIEAIAKHFGMRDTMIAEIIETGLYKLVSTKQAKP